MIVSHGVAVTLLACQVAALDHSLFLHEIRASAATKGALQIIGAGHGTTGTHSLYKELCAMGFKAMHWASVCNSLHQGSGKTKTAVANDYYISRVGVGGLDFVQREEDAIRKVIGSVVDLGIQAVTDSPVFYMIDELIASFPKAKVVLTKRAGPDWARSRMTNHHREVICLESAQHLNESVEEEGMPPLHHPFALRACAERARLRAARNGGSFPPAAVSPFVKYSDFLTEARKYGHGDGVAPLVEAYKCYNDYVRRSLPPERILEVDFWTDDACEFHHHIEEFIGSRVDAAWRGNSVGTVVGGNSDHGGKCTPCESTPGAPEPTLYPSPRKPITPSHVGTTESFTRIGHRRKNPKMPAPASSGQVDSSPFGSALSASRGEDDRSKKHKIPATSPPIPIRRVTTRELNITSADGFLANLKSTHEQSTAGAQVASGTTGSLAVIVAGHGTTGTHSIFKELCAMGFRSWHWDLLCTETSGSTANRSMTIGKRFYLKSAPMEFGEDIPAVTAQLERDSVLETVKDFKTMRIQALADSPVYYMLDELLASFPNARVILSVREANAWAQSRLHSHSNEVICRESVHGIFHKEEVGLPQLPHAFAVRVCAERAAVRAARKGALIKKQQNQTSGALVSTVDFVPPIVNYKTFLGEATRSGSFGHNKFEPIIRAYNQYNEYVRKIVPKGQLLEVNLFEEEACEVHVRVEKFLGRPVHPDWRGNMIGTKVGDVAKHRGESKACGGK